MLPSINGAGLNFKTNPQTGSGFKTLPKPYTFGSNVASVRPVRVSVGARRECRSRSHRSLGLGLGLGFSEPVLQRRRRLDGFPHVPKAAGDVAVPGDGGDEKEEAKTTGFFNVFSDPKCNAKLFALATGQMLCSVATLIHDTYLPVYMQDVLGLSNTKIGAVQGTAQFLAQLAKGVSGIVGDILGSQIRVVIFGTFLTLLCKPMFALSYTVSSMFGVTACLYWIVMGKLFDRMSKGIREAPTKAVMNELAKESGDTPDAAYGLRQSLATAGALIGSSAAGAVFFITRQNFILTFATAAVPPAIALAWLVSNFGEDVSKAVEKRAAKKAEDAAKTEEGEKTSLLFKAKALLRSFQPAYWQALFVIIVLYFARFDASFLLLRAKQVMPKTEIASVTFLQMSCQALLTAPLAKIAGTSVNRRNTMLTIGFMMMICANAVFGLPYFASRWGMWLGAVFLALHMSMTHSITLSMVGSYMPTGVVEGVGKLSGTAWSVTDFILGFALMASNAVAGILSDVTSTKGWGNVGCFAGGASACLFALILLNLFASFGHLGKDELVATRRRKK